jgi:hypothetical protein
MKDDIEFHGANMMIFAQYFIVAETKLLKIRLNGQNAHNYSSKSQGDNQDGKPGKPGKNAGNLFIKVYEKC